MSSPTSEEKLAALENYKPSDGKPAAAAKPKPAKAAEKRTAAAKPSKNGKGKQTAAEEVESPKKFRAVKLEGFPSGEKKQLAPSALTMDDEIQMRVDLTDAATVEEYARLYKEGVDLGELRAISDGKDIWVYDGFERQAAAKLASIKSVPVIVTDGTRDDARFLALRANSFRGLSRTPDDCRKCVLAMVNDPELYGRVKASAEKYGGLNRALALATGLSKGFVSKVLNDAGLTIKKGDVAKITAETPKPKRKKKKSKEPEQLGLFDPILSHEARAPEGMPETFEQFQQLPKAEQKELNTKALADLTASVLYDRFREAGKVLKRLAALVTTFLTDKKEGSDFRKALAGAGYPVEKDWDYKPLGDKESGEAYFALLEHWPVANALGILFDTCARKFMPADEKAAELAAVPEEAAAAK